MGVQSTHTAHATYQLTVSLVSQNVAGNYSTLRITYVTWADSGWGSGTYASGIGFSATGYGNGSFNINGTSATICDFYFNAGHDANGYCNYSFSVSSNATGTSTYGGPVGLTDSGSLARIPKPPKPAPTLTAAAPVGRSITVTSGVPAGYDEGGAVTQSIDIQYSKDGGAWSTTSTGGWGNRTFSNLAPGSYVFRALARNAYGNSAWSANTAARQIQVAGNRWNGSNWVQLVTAKRWSGTAWVDLVSKRATAVGTANWVYTGT